MVVGGGCGGGDVEGRRCAHMAGGGAARGVLWGGGDQLGGGGPCMRPPPAPPPGVLKDSGTEAMGPKILTHAELKGVLCLWSLRPLRLFSRQRREIDIIAYIPLSPHASRHTHPP